MNKHSSKSKPGAAGRNRGIKRRSDKVNQGPLTECENKVNKKVCRIASPGFGWQSICKKQVRADHLDKVKQGPLIECGNNVNNLRRGQWQDVCKKQMNLRLAHQQAVLMKKRKGKTRRGDHLDTLNCAGGNGHTYTKAPHDD